MRSARPTLALALAGMCSMGTVAAEPHLDANRQRMAWREAVKVSPVLPGARHHCVHPYGTASPESPDGRWVLFYASTAPDGHEGEVSIVERQTGRTRTLVRDVTVEDIRSTRRHKSIALPRHVAMYLAREMTTMSWKEIGRHFGRSNHTGALFAHKKIASAVAKDPMLASRISRVRAELGG